MLAVTEGQSTRACDQNTSDGGSVRRTWSTRVIRFAFYVFHSFLLEVETNASFCKCQTCAIHRMNHHQEQLRLLPLSGG